MIDVKLTKEETLDRRAAYLALFQACREAGAGGSVRYHVGVPGTVPESVRRAVGELYEHKVANPVTRLTKQYVRDARITEYILQVRRTKK